MTNTVVLTGRGWSANLLFLRLLDAYPEAKFTNLKLRWWQSQVRIQLRIQNMQPKDILRLRVSLASYWPFNTPVDIQVF